MTDHASAPPTSSSMHALVLLASVALVEQASDALMFELEALSVSVDDADAHSEAEQALFGEPGMPAADLGWQRSRLTALFHSETQARSAADTLLAEPWARTLQFVAIESVPDADWVRLTQSQFEPVGITESFWVVPSWHAAPTTARQVLRLDPGLAFGSGTHATTHMCLRWIAEHASEHVAERRVLDYGCGSGILGIAAAMHGARDVDAVDIDATAVETSIQNARNNGVAMRAGMPDLAEGRYDVVVANILATPLKVMAPLLAAHVTPGGWLVLAGVLTRQFDELQAAYRPDVQLSVSDEREGWVLLTGRRRPHSLT